MESLWKKLQRCIGLSLVVFCIALNISCSSSSDSDDDGSIDNIDKFETEYLEGKTFYSHDIETVDTVYKTTFNAQLSTLQNGTVVIPELVAVTGLESQPFFCDIDENGILEITFSTGSSDVTFYSKIIDSTEEYLKVCKRDTLDECLTCVDANRYWFFDMETFNDFLDNQENIVSSGASENSDEELNDSHLSEADECNENSVRESGAIQWFDVVVNSQPYTYEKFDTNIGWQSSSWGFGPDMYTGYSDEWPADYPDLRLSISLSGFKYDEGIESGKVIDLSNPDPKSDIKVSLNFSISSPPTGIVGDQSKYAVYYAGVINEANAMWIPGGSGTVEIVNFHPKQTNDIHYTTDYETDIWMTNVLFKKVSSNENFDAPLWPNEIIVSSAHFCTMSDSCCDSLSE